MVKHKVFSSYYHRDDQRYRNDFERRFGHLFIAKSVQPGDIDSDNSAEYIKRLIQDDYIGDASIVVVLVGPKTKCRKHVDWEISAGLSKKVGGYSGLLGILLPELPLTADGKYDPANLPARLAENVKTGYVKVYRWDWITGDPSRTIAAVEEAFGRREESTELIRNGLVQMQRNTCD